MTERIIDGALRLIPYYRNDAASLPWYQDLTACKQVDDRDTPYDAELLHCMYDFLSTHGDCYYIEYQGVLVGDVSLRENGEIAIVVCREYQNRHIGRRCVLEMLRLAREKRMARVMKINAADGTLLYAGSGKDATSFALNIQESGAYTVAIEARRAKGSIYIQTVTD